MLNVLFVVVVLLSVAFAAWNGSMQAVTDAILLDSKKAVDLSLKLIGIMAFFLGLMKVIDRAGVLHVLVRVLRPLLRRLFPGVPADHPAHSAMILNVASNMLGLGNAATPFGIKAMEELDKLNREKGTASNAMILFLAINTAGLAVLPSGMIGQRAALGSQDATGIFLTTWMASGTATLVGIAIAFLLSRLPAFSRTAPETAEPSVTPSAEAASERANDSTDAASNAVEAEAEEELVPPRFGKPLAVLFWVAIVAALGRYLYLAAAGGDGYETVRSIFSYWMLPIIVSIFILFGWVRGVRVYETMVEGAKEGFQVAIRIIPYLVAILVMAGMFRAAGGFDVMQRILGPVTSWIGMPVEVLPLALMRPLTGSGAFGLSLDLMSTHGPDSLIGYMASTMYGSTETTFYVLAVYFGAVGVRRTRHALPTCLAADFAGIAMAVFSVNLFFG